MTGHTVASATCATIPHSTPIRPAYRGVGHLAARSALARSRARREDQRAVIQDDPRQAEAVEAHQAPEAGRRAEFNRYFAVRAHMGNLAFSPDGRQIAYIVNTSGQFNIWRQAIAGGWASQITTFERETVRGLIWSPSGDVIAAADTDGSEQYQIFSIPAAGGPVRYFTDRPDAQFELSPDGFSPDGRFLAFAGNDRNPTDADVLVRDLTTGQTQRVLVNGRYNIAVNWSPYCRCLTPVDPITYTDLSAS